MSEKRGPKIWNNWLTVVFAVGQGPLVVIFLWLVWTSERAFHIRATLSLMVLGCSAFCMAYLYEKVAVKIRDVAALLSALREGDRSLRLSEREYPGGLAQVVTQANALRDTLSEQRKDVAETAALLNKVMTEIDAAVFTFDPGMHLGLVNRRGLEFLGRDRDRAEGRHAEALGLSRWLTGDAPRVDEVRLAGEQRRFEIRRTSFREAGRTHTLLMIADLTDSLRREELDAWQRLVRVLRHEISNSLAPIQSLSDTLLWRLQSGDDLEGARGDLDQGLTVIGRRAASLTRMIKSYSGVTDLPQPQLSQLDVAAWVARNRALTTAAEVTVEAGPATTLRADGDQLDQLLINLLKNAAEAVTETGGGVTVRWSHQGGRLQLEVLDEGPGLEAETHLFVPFFTTKQEGTGIGLFLSRKIAEAHGGRLELRNREDRRGAVAVLRLPLS